MIRFSDWQSRLDSFLVENAARKFQYGRWDCCLFVCDAIEILTGVDPAKDFRGKYSTAVGAKALLRTRYGSPSVWNVTRAITAKLELEECTPTLARRGDLVLIPRKVDYSLGLIDLTGQMAVLTRKEGIIRLPFTEAQIGWHV